MANLDLSGFQTPEQSYAGLYRAGELLQRERDRQDRLGIEKEGKKTATSKFLTNYLDPNDHLTGTAYDPQIVSGFQDLLQQGQDLASKGASTPDILMALGPKVAKLNDYSTKAKLINGQIKESIGRLKGYAGYNPEALETQAKKEAFYGPDGKLKDISLVDPNQDYITMATKNNPELVTSSKGLDDFVAKTPMADYSRSVAVPLPGIPGRSKNVKYEAKHPFWEDLQRDENGNIMTDSSGNPIGLGVTGSTVMDDKGNPIINPETKQPFMAMDKNNFNSIMSYNPDVADYIRGQVNQHFKAAGAKTIPTEGSPQWDMMARSVLHDELQRRGRSTFRTIDQTKESPLSLKIETGQNPEALRGLAEYEQAAKLKGDYAVYDPKAQKSVKTNAVEAVGKIFNNDPVFLNGEHKEIAGRNVIDVTDFLPGGGLKSGRGGDEVYRGIYYDPNKRSLLVTQQARTKDPTGQKPTDLEEIPESKAGLFMTRIAAANGVDPTKVGDILSGLGYQSAKFTRAAQPGEVSTQLNQEHSEKVDTALKNEKYDDLKGIQTSDGTVQKVNDRYIRAATGLVANKFSVEVKAPDGTEKTLYFKDKDALTNYIKGSQPKAKAAPNTGASGIKWQ